MYHLPTVPNPRPNHHQHQRQQVPPPPSPHHPSGPYDIGNWELRWRRRTTYDAYGRLVGTDIQEEATYTPPHLRPLPPPMQRERQGLLWLFVLFLMAPLAFPLIIVGLMLLSVILSVLQQVLLPVVLVVTGLFMLLLIYRRCKRP